MDKRKTYSGAFKAKVVIEFLGGKIRLEELAQKYQVHPNQIKNWKTLLFKRAHLIFVDRRQGNN
ncbi:MAG: transposase [Deltaproteobacteria bacterium]|nr:transposase [Deltaproteobacteria bacterium]